MAKPIGAPQEDKSRGGINLGKLTQEQEVLFNSLFDHFEAYPTDANKIRVVLTDGRKGPWFSRLWDNITWKQFWPS